MSRRCGVVLACLLFASSLFADDQAVWREYGLVHTDVAKQGRLTITTYEMKDLTGALAAWEWRQPSNGTSCEFSAFCSENAEQTVVTDYNYVIIFDGAKPSKAQVTAALNELPNKRETSLPGILSFLPRQGLVPNSARYLLGPVSYTAFAPDLGSAHPGFDQGAEAQVAQYRVSKNGSPVRLALFNYPSPEMARLHTAQFKRLRGVRVKRSDVLVAIVYGPVTDAQADTLLSRVQYEAKITWNDTPPPSPIKPLYQLLVNILYLSIVLSALCLLAGLIYAAMRIYRRRYGTLESDEAMTTLHLGS